MRPHLIPLLIPGTVFWALVIVGLATGNTAIWVATGIVGAATAIGFAASAIRGSSKRRATRKRVCGQKELPAQHG